MIRPRALFLFFLSFIVVPSATAQVAVTPADGADVFETEIEICWPAQAGAESYDLRFYEANYDPFSNDFVEKLFLNTTVTEGTCFEHDFKDMGSATILWTFLPLGADTSLLPTAGGTTGQLFSFTLSGFGDTLAHIPPQVSAVGTPIDFTVSLVPPPPGPGRSPTEHFSFKKPNKQSKLRANIKSCVKKRLNRLPRVTALLFDENSLELAEKRRKARKVRARSRCRAELHGESKRVKGRLGTPANPFAVQCYRAEQLPTGGYLEIPCPAEMTIQPNGRFQFVNPEPVDIMVMVLFDNGSNSDSQFFRATFVSDPIGRDGVAGPLTYLDQFPHPVGQSGYVGPWYTELGVSSTAPSLFPHCAVDGETHGLSCVWMPDRTSSTQWSYTFKIDAEWGAQMDGQHMNLVERLWIIFGDRACNPAQIAAGCIPSANLLPSDLRVEYSTDPGPEPTTFHPVSNSIYVESLSPSIACTSLNADCPAAINIDKQATHFRVTGLNADSRLPAVRNFLAFGWRGEGDCAVFDDSKWRTLAYLDADRDCVPDLDVHSSHPIGLVHIPKDIADGCYGLASDLAGTDYLAPEKARLTPDPTGLCLNRNVGRSPR